MNDMDTPSSPRQDHDGDAPTGPETAESPQRSKMNWAQIWESLLRVGLGETALRFGTALSSIVLVLLVIWVMSTFYLRGEFNTASEVAIAAPQAAPTALLKQPPLQPMRSGAFDGGIARLRELHTSLPVQPRGELTTYIVQKGDTIFGIAEKFNLKPETILWGNYYTLVDDPHRLQPGQELIILPVNGVYYRWNAGDGLNAVARFYGVAPEDIIQWPGNRLNPDTLGDWASPNIEPGTFLVVPNGRREFVTWSAPRITRQNPGVAKIFGPGACGTITDGPVGTGTFVWPSVERYLSGFDYSPETNHRGIDVAGKMGNAIFAADSGVVVYAGWNDWGYGNVVVVDHGNGWQTLYAHLSTLNVACGSYVYQGDAIAGMGSTGNSSGPHLHYEMLSDEYGKVNPWNFLQ